MKNHAFTLIELLVVVLIIGILSAIALPQYQSAVDKSRMAELMTLVRNSKDLQEIYRLTNGQYATNCEELGMEAPAGYELNASKWYFNDSKKYLLRCTNQKSTGIFQNDQGSNLAAYAINFAQTPNQITCWSNATERYKKLCSSICGVAVAENFNTDGASNGFSCIVQ